MNETELFNVGKVKAGEIRASRKITDDALDTATGTTREQRRAAVNAVCNRFKERYCRTVFVDPPVATLAEQTK